MRAAWWLIAMAWGAGMGLVVSAMTGVWWQFPYWAAATVALTVGGFVALWRAP